MGPWGKILKGSIGFLAPGARAPSSSTPKSSDTNIYFSSHLFIFIHSFLYFLVELKKKLNFNMTWELLRV